MPVMDSERKIATVNLGGGLGGCLVTIAIIAIRAMQANAEPMSEWSAWSWVWMTLPMTWGALVVIFGGTMAFLVALLMAAFPTTRR